jgi:hypothetical protein
MNVTVDGDDLSGRYQPSELEAISIRFEADRGEVGVGTLVLPDPDGTLEHYAGQQLLLEVGATTVLDGFVGATRRDRGGTIGGRLVHYHSLLDDNALLNGHVAAWTRPEELDWERMEAFVDHFLGHLTLDTTWLLHTNAQTVPGKKYLTEALFQELQDDLEKATGKTMFIEHRRFHWHLPTEGIISDMAIVATGEDRIDTFALDSATPPNRSKDPGELGVKVYARNDAGDSRAATDGVAQGRHDGAGLRHERLVEEPDASPTYLQSIANVTLTRVKAERITYEGTIGPLTAEQLERIPVGCLINVTDDVWGLTESTQRIAAMTVTYKHPDQFMASLELGYPIRLWSKPPKTSPPPVQPPAYVAPPCASLNLDAYVDTFPDGPVENDYFASTGSGAGEWDTGEGTWTLTYTTGDADAGDPVTIGQDAGRVYCKLPVDNGVGSYVHAALVGYDDIWQNVAFRVDMVFDWDSTNMGDGGFPFGFAGDGPFVQLGQDYVFYPFTSLNGIDNGEVLTSPTRMIWECDPDGGEQRVKFFDAADPVPSTWDIVDNTITAFPSDMEIQVARGDALGTGEVEFGIRSFTLEPIDPCDDAGPLAGQERGPELAFVGDTAQDAGITNYPYMPGSLKVWLDGLRTFDFDETDPTTGDFTLDTPPGTGVNVRVEYKGA